MRMVDLIIKKRDGIELTNDEIHFWINGYVNGDIPDYQSSAMTMAIMFKGMTKKEVSCLTDAMLHSGNILDLSNIKGIKVDKHSTGGVGDKTSLVLGSMVAACGGTVAKLSGRGLGHTGGTLDKLESIPGLSIQIEGKRFEEQVNSIGLAIAGQTAKLVPADKKLYSLRDVTGTVESIPLIASSIMSKKLASGSDAILLDVTVGDGAFMKNIDDARELAITMKDIGNSLGKNTKAVISDMDEPLGNAVGNALEVKEAIAALKDQGPEDLKELCLSTGSIMLEQAKIVSSIEEGRKVLENSLKDGSAFNKFRLMVQAQGGDVSYIDNPDKFELAKHIIPIISQKEGYVHKIKALAIGISSMKLGGGREKIEDTIDMSAGIILNKKVGDYVKKGEALAYAHTNKDNVDDILQDIFEAFIIGNEKVDHIKVIKEVIQ